jgi:hypothetical protein
MKLVSKTREGSKVYRKYDQALTPYQRVLADENLSSARKQQQKERFQSLDPLSLAHQIHAAQENLWQYADTRSLRAPKPSKIELEILLDAPDQIGANSSAPEKEITLSERFYRKTKRKITHSKPRYWRTRKDPFADVWPEIEHQLQLTPHLPAKTLFLALQKKYPMKFSDGQLRTLQRRVKDWREEQIQRMDSQENESESTSLDMQ